MKYTITKWTIKKLYDTYKKEKLNLSPVYQRNFIWSIADQQYLINSIQKNNPIPNFFILEKAPNIFEMVDGQQRSRTIISYIDNQFPNLDGKIYLKKDFPNFEKYAFPVTIITDTQGESIEKFYALVNKTGIHVNTPEIRKADFYNTNYLKLVNDVVTSKLFVSLRTFTESSLKRMNDVEFVAELVVLIKDGHVDKKGNIDEYFKKDLSAEECLEIKSKINLTLSKISLLNKVYKLKKTRYKQKNDFYTLFDFILRHNLEVDTIKYFYKILVLIGKDIKPTQDKCLPLKEYARNCVTQSNSKLARQNRLDFFQKLFLNRTTKLNKVQSSIIRFYRLKTADVKNIEGFKTINVEKLSIFKPSIEFE